MAVIFPMGLLPDAGFTVSELHRTLTSMTETGKEYRRRKWERGKRVVRMRYSSRYHSDIAQIWDFYRERAGAYGSFIYVFPFSETWKGEYVGTGDGTTTTWKLPVWNDYTALTIYVNGVQKTEGTDYTITTYTDDRPSVTFTTAPAQGDKITCDFTGKPALIMRFAVSDLSRTLMETLLTTVGIELQEVW